MRKDTTKLKILFFAPIILSALFALGCETDIIESGCGITAEDNMGEVISLYMMEIVTLCAIPLALRLFKFGAIARKVKSSRQWFMRLATVRITMLTVPLLIDTMLYYHYMAPTYAYMAVMILLAMAFVYPSESRCKNETE